MFFTETRVTVELRSVNDRGRKTWVAAFHLSQILAFERSNHHDANDAELFDLRQGGDCAQV
jgi:hypothetical protein